MEIQHLSFDRGILDARINGEIVSVASIVLEELIDAIDCLSDPSLTRKMNPYLSRFGPCMRWEMAAKIGEMYPSSLSIAFE